MSADWLLVDDAWRRLLALTCILLPALLILFSRRCGWVRKLAWTAASQLPWLFLWIYMVIARARYPEQALSLQEAAGWWLLAYPWAVYLLYRATRRRFAGEPKRERKS